jgi:type II secretory pathway pseudopilin PulG
MKNSFSRFGFTLTELLVIIGIIGIFLALLLPAIQHVRAAADRFVCQSNLRQIATAIHLYHADYKHVPKSAHRVNWQTDPNSLLSNLSHLLPYIEQEQAFAKALQATSTGARPWKNPPHEPLAMVMKLYLCPADSRLNQTMTDADGITAAYGSYLPCSGSGEPNGQGIFGVTLPFLQGIPFSAVSDGLSNTLMIGERPPPDTLQAGKWYPQQTTTFGKYGILVGPDDSLSVLQLAPSLDPCGGRFWFGPGRTDNPCDRYHFWSLHSGGSLFAFGDASVHWIPYSTHRSVVMALATRFGGEVVSIPE